MPQPGLPQGEARLLALREQDGVVVLEFEGGLSYEVAADAVPATLPAVGAMVDEATLRGIAMAADRKLAARRLFKLLDRRLQPVGRLRAKLLAEGHLPEAVDQVLASMQEQGLHSDRQYAEAYCRDCLLSRAVGRGYLEAKLRNKGLDAAVARAAAEAVLDPDRERELATRAARARWRKLGPDSSLQALAKVVRHLHSRGFSPGDSQAAARATRPDPDHR